MNFSQMLASLKFHKVHIKAVETAIFGTFTPEELEKYIGCFDITDEQIESTESSEIQKTNILLNEVPIYSVITTRKDKNITTETIKIGD